MECPGWQGARDRWDTVAFEALDLRLRYSQVASSGGLRGYRAGFAKEPDRRLGRAKFARHLAGRIEKGLHVTKDTEITTVIQRIFAPQGGFPYGFCTFRTISEGFWRSSGEFGPCSLRTFKPCADPGTGWLLPPSAPICPHLGLRWAWLRK
jgi:hypothetical protein